MSAKRQKLVGDLNAAVGTDGVVFVDASEGLGAKAVVTCGGAKVEVWTFGAHTVSWQVDGVERTWMSGLSKMDGSAPIRGGVPLAFPQFADQGALPLHGFARTQLWTVAGSATTQTADGPRTSITLTLTDSPATQALWPHKFALAYTLTLGPRSIEFELTASNTGDSAWSFTGCLHTYLKFDDSSLVSPPRNRHDTITNYVLQQLYIHVLDVHMYIHFYINSNSYTGTCIPCFGCA